MATIKPLGNDAEAKVEEVEEAPSAKRTKFTEAPAASRFGEAIRDFKKLDGLKFITSGKVRDIYEVDDKTLLFVTSDRLSAFDVVMKNGVPGKGKILNQITTFWLNWIAENNLCKHHMITDNVDEMPEAVKQHKAVLQGRSMLVKKLKMLPVESIARGYITGSGWKDYGKTGSVCGIKLPEGLKHCQQLAEPIFTPSTKAEYGLHDENISAADAAKLVGEALTKKCGDLCLEIYKKAAAFAKTKGIILADTKFEFGLDEDENVVLADEVLTPDSSRYWPADQYEVGRNQDSFDKQYVRNWLEDIKFDKTNPVTIPDEVCANTTEKYVQIFTLLTGKEPVY